jgi:signal transduction histidine kinase
VQRFEAVLASAISCIARASAHEIDREIERWLGEICMTLDLDRSAVLLKNEGITHRWHRENVPNVRYGTLGVAISPWASRRVLLGEELVWAKPSDLPREASDYKLWIQQHGPRSQAVFPLRIGNEVAGGISFGKFRSARKWPGLLIRRLRLAAQVFAGALERKRVETELTRARNELAAASSSTMLGELAASIAHEVNQPLGAILANAQAARRLIRSGAEAAKVESALTDIVDDAKRAGEVVMRVRALFKGDRSQRAALTPGALLEEAQSLLRSEAAIRKIELQLDTEPALPPVMGDRVQLLQCVMNLAINAFDSIVSAARASRETTLGARRENDRWVRISVADTGRGIAQEIYDRIFDPFVTTKSNGMGMGLMIAQSIVSNHGGRIWVSSNSDKGATVSFTLPVYSGEQPAAAS